MSRYRRRRNTRLARWAKRLAKRLRLGRWRRPGLWALAVLALAILVSSRVEAPPRQPEDICAIFSEKRDWFDSARRSYEAWGVPESVQMAVIYQESGFRARARPRRRILWVLPGPRRSSAYGYAQVLDSTWAQFQKDTDRPRAWRHRFSDVTQFIGWYGSEIHRLTGIARNDAYRFYLAYHEGPGGYARGSYRQKAWLMQTARQVEARAARYQRQYSACRSRLERRGAWRWIVAALLIAAAGWGYRRWRRRP